MSKQLVDILCACSGTREDALALAPKGRAQAATLGLLLVLTATIASLTSGYALRQAFLGDRFANFASAFGGLCWGGLVFCIDRLMILGIDKFATPARLATQVLTRVPLALIIALVMSKPFILRLTERVTDGELRAQQRQTIAREADANAQEAKLADRQKTVQDLKEAREKHEERLRQEPDSYRYRSAAEELQRKEEQYGKVFTTNAQRIARASRELEEMRVDRIGGELTAKEQTRIGLLRERIDFYQREIAAAQAALTSARAEKEESSQQWVRDETDAVKEITHELEGAVKAEADASTHVGARNSEAEREIARIMAPNLINQYRILRRITGDPRHPDSGAVMAFEISLDVFFIVLELTPVLLKVLAKKGSLDYATTAVEFLDQERINLGANTEATRRQTRAEAALAVEEQLWAAWREAQLQTLQTGVLSIAELMRLRREVNEATA